MKFRNKNFNLNGDIVDFDIKDPITLEVKQFYEKYPFPNYKIDDNKHTILKEGDKNTFFKELKNFILENDLYSLDVFEEGENYLIVYGNV